MRSDEEVSVFVEGIFVTSNIKLPILNQLLASKGVLLAVHERIGLIGFKRNNFAPIFEGEDGMRSTFGEIGILRAMVMVPLSNFLYKSVAT